MTTTLTEAARRVITTQRDLARPYVPTSRTDLRSASEVQQRRRKAAADALATLAVCVAAQSWSCVQVDGVVHKVRMDGRVACTGGTAEGWPPRDPRSVLTVDNACPDCDWGLA